jgi:hypothetical protein
MLAELSPLLREAIVLRYYFGYADAQIAMIVRCQPAAVRKRLQRGIAALERIIHERYAWLLSVTDRPLLITVTPSLLMRPQALTLVVTRLDLTPLVAVGGVNSIDLRGLWQVPFVVTPIAPEVRTFQVAPIIHTGVSVQPVSLETFSGQHPFDMNSNQGAGARLILRFSGLSTPGALQNAPFFDSAGPNFSTTAGAHLTFNGQVPTVTDVLPGSAQGDTEQVEILFWVPLRFSGSTTTLTIDHIRDGFPPLTYATGPWTFDLPIS